MPRLLLRATTTAHRCPLDDEAELKAEYGRHRPACYRRRSSPGRRRGQVGDLDELRRDGGAGHQRPASMHARPAGADDD